MIEFVGIYIGYIVQQVRGRPSYMVKRSEGPGEATAPNAEHSRRELEIKES